LQFKKNSARTINSISEDGLLQHFLQLQKHLRAEWVAQAFCSGGSGVQSSDEARGDCWMVCSMQNYSIKQWRMVAIVTGYIFL